MLGVLPALPSLKDTYPSVKDHSQASKRKAFEVRQSKDAGGAGKRGRVEEGPGGVARDLMVNELLGNTLQCGSQAATTAAVTALDGAPTDFSGLFPKTASCPVEPRKLRTFEDIATQRQNRGALKELAGNQLPTDLPALLPRLAPSVLAGPSGSGAGTLTAAERELLPSAQPPLDWSLKTTARFSSPTPFAICDDAAEACSQEVVEVHRCVAGCRGTAGLSLRQQYLAALLSFQHPQAPRPLAAGARARGGPDAEAVERRQDWQEAFISLYDTFRAGQCGAFYYVAPEGSAKGFVAFFGAAGVGGRRRMHAILTRSTAGARALLQQGLGHGFAAPLMPEGGGGPDAGDGGAGAAAAAGGTQSMLVFEGALRVHGLFDFLLNESWRLHGHNCDVPLLLAPTQFLHGCLRAVQPKVLPADLQSQHRLELRGLLLPWVLDRLAAIFAATQDGAFTLLCDTHPHTLCLNWQPAGEAAGKGAVDDCSARERGCWDGEEAARWAAAVPGLSCNVVRELRCEGGAFTARLSDKSAARLG